MRTQSVDTGQKAEKFLLELIKGKTPQDRLRSMQSLSLMTIHLAKRAIERANPRLSKQELGLLFVKYHYGEDLYNRVKSYFSKVVSEKK